VGAPQKWVIDCAHVGRGKPALKYLSRYLYRGVISEHAIVSVQDGLVTFSYTDSKTGKTQYRTLKGEDFCRLVLQHVLPKGFRRVRDYGFLHGNANTHTGALEKRYSSCNWCCGSSLKSSSHVQDPSLSAPHCQVPMNIIGFIQPCGNQGKQV